MQEELIKVVVRVRPFSFKENTQHVESCLQILPGGTQLILGKDRPFTFDYIFSPNSAQEDIFEFCVKSLVQSCFEGYNATVFAYGQTGSGKTYTIGGGDIASLSEEEYGIIPRAIRYMFEIIKGNKKIHYSFKVSYIEIYKEELNDLLDLDTASKDMHIREDDQGNSVIIGHQEITCVTAEDVINCLETGSSLRHIGCTMMNKHSSRAHSIFTIIFEQSWTEKNICEINKAIGNKEIYNNEDCFKHFRYGKFHFVDLAGSERVQKTGNTGERFKESVHINTGLLALGNVISALSDPKRKVTHIPYRDSKLTRILKNSLGGNAKTVMVCCVSPCSTSFDETLNSLKYANRVKNIKNKPIVNRDLQSLKFEAMQSEILALRDELQRHRESYCTTVSDQSLGQPCTDISDVKLLEDQLLRLQTELGHYKMLAEEAQDLLKDIEQEQTLTSIHQDRIGEWLEIMDEVESKVPIIDPKPLEQTDTINWQKKEIEELRERNSVIECDNNDISNLLQEAVSKEKIIQQQLIEKDKLIKNLEEQIMQLEKKCDNNKHEVNNESLDPENCGDTRRIKSAPMIGNILEVIPSDFPPRNIHTCPALFSIERIFNGFHVRSQLLMSSLEESDEVLQKKLRESRTATRLNCKGGQHKTLVKNSAIQAICAPKSINKANFLSASAIINRSSSMPMSFLAYQRVKQQNNKMVLLQSSLDMQRQQLKEVQTTSWDILQKMREMEQHMKYKENAIKELVLTNKQVHILNKHYQEKIETLKREAEQTKLELTGAQKLLKELEGKGQIETTEKQDLRNEYQKKIELSNTRYQALQKRKMDTERAASLGMDTDSRDKRVQGLEQSLDRMKCQYDHLQKKFKEELELKCKLEKELERDQLKIQELESQNEHQQKALKRKTLEKAAIQRKLLLNGKQCAAEKEKDEQSHWLDSEIEKMLLERQRIKDLQEELERREAAVRDKETLISQKKELELEKMKSSQIISQDILSMANQLEHVEKHLEKKNSELKYIDSNEEQEKLREEITELRQARDKLIKQRKHLEEKLHQGNVLPEHQERKLIELDEAIEAMDAAMEYKNELIANKRKALRQSQAIQGEDSLFSQLNSLSHAEIRIMLLKYFEKVVDLREDAQKKDITMNEMESRIDQQERALRELQGALRRNVMERDCKLLQQQQEYEKKIQLFIQQMNEANETNSEAIKTQQLQKELYFYKVQCRQLKRESQLFQSNQTESNQRLQKDMVLSGRELINKKSEPLSPRQETLRMHRNMYTQNKDIPSVKISRRDVRQLSESELALRRSNCPQDGSIPSDSLECNTGSFYPS